jgi:hypothetical protein
LKIQAIYIGRIGNLKPGKKLEKDVDILKVRTLKSDDPDLAILIKWRLVY